MPLWSLMEGYVITEYRDGCVFKTESVGFKWFEVGTSVSKLQPPISEVDQIRWGSISTKIMVQMEYKNIVVAKEAPPVPDWLPAYKEVT